MRKYIPRNANVAGYCYLIEAKNSDGLYKIGLTRNPDRRIDQLNSSQSPYHLVYVKLIEVDDMASVESDLHQQFKAYGSGKNEWFRFTPQQVNQVIAAMDVFEQGEQIASNPIALFRTRSPFTLLALALAVCSVAWAILSPLMKPAPVAGHATVGSATATASKPAQNRCVVAAPLLNVRSGAGANYPISGKPLLSGTVVEKLDQADGWIYSRQGWLAANHVRCENDPT